MIILKTDNLVKYYGEKMVVKGVNLEVKQGEIVGLLGPNGAGKTTTFFMMVGIIKPNRGYVFLSNEDITDLPMHKRARKGIGYLSQEPSVFRKLTVEENIMSILETLDISQSEREKRLISLLSELNISHLAKQISYTLSGGERRRVEITRALVTEPKFMLLDEPFVGIDPIAVADIQEIIKQLKMKGIGVLITDHNVRETLTITDRAYIMFDGNILLSGTAQELANNEKAREVYLGARFSL